MHIRNEYKFVCVHVYTQSMHVNVCFQNIFEIYVWWWRVSYLSLVEMFWRRGRRSKKNMCICIYVTDIKLYLYMCICNLYMYSYVFETLLKYTCTRGDDVLQVSRTSGCSIGEGDAWNERYVYMYIRNRYEFPCVCVYMQCIHVTMCHQIIIQIHVYP